MPPVDSLTIIRQRVKERVQRAEEFAKFRKGLDIAAEATLSAYRDVLVIIEEETTNAP